MTSKATLTQRKLNEEAFIQRHGMTVQEMNRLERQEELAEQYREMKEAYEAKYE